MSAAGWHVTRPEVAFPYFEERSPPIVAGLRPTQDIATAALSAPADVTARVGPLDRSGCRPGHFRRFVHGRIAISPGGNCLFRRIALNAQRAGAVALLVADAGGPPTAATLLRPGVSIPVLLVRFPAARRLARSQRRIRVRVDALNERRTATNVVAELPGTEGTRVAMAGGHLDSVAQGPGVNDNGSGVAALLEIGERLAAQPRRRDTLRLGFWTGEELFLYGSRAYVRSLPGSERRRMTAYLNLDMLGSPNAVPELYASTRRIARLLRRLFPGAGRTGVNEPSDHVPFLKAGIPVGGLYTGSTERKTRRQARRWGGRALGRRDPCYHRACDGVHNVDAEMLARMANAALGALTGLAR